MKHLDMLKIICRNAQIPYRSLLLRHYSSNGGASQLAYVQHIGKQPLIYENLGQQLEKSVQKYAKRIVIKSEYDQRELTYEEAYGEAAILTIKLQELGLKRGEHLAIWAPNTVHWFITFLASALGGFPLVCINPALQKPELEYALEKGKANAMITMNTCGKLDFLKTLKQIDRRDVKVIMQTDKQVQDFVSYDDLLQDKPSPQQVSKFKSNIGENQPESPCLMQFTSGTTGKPKCALISHFNMVNQALFVGKTLNLDQGQKSICLTVPMFHAFGLSVMTAAVNNGSTLCLPSPTFNPAASLDLIEREKCQVVVGTPTMYVDMIDQQSQMPRNIGCLDFAWIGGSACTPEVLSRTKEILRIPNIRVGYGLSESTGAIFAMDGTESAEDAMLSCGKLFEHGEAKIVDEHGNTLKFGQEGELCVRGWFTMLGYLEDDENTRKIIDFNGWLRTGDQFLLKPNGIARYQGRQKDLIIRGGENIFPKEIEDVIDKHPSVLESQVIGVPDDRLGEEVCLYLRLSREAKPLTLDDIKAFCKGKLAYFKIPKHIRILEEFPKTTSGKIQKFKLQEMYKQE